MTISVLQKTPTLLKDPYPHVIIEDALPEDVYNRLEKEWPEQQLLNTEPFDNGICYRLKSDQMLKPNLVSDAWREFAEYHTSAKFYNEVKCVFGDLMPTVENVSESISARGWDTGGDKIGTDCQTVMHKPVNFSSRTPHIDNPREIYAGLLYMPYADDDSKGGDFQLHRQASIVTEVNKNGGRAVGNKAGEIVKTVPYKRNTFVMFLNNSTNTIHSVSARSGAIKHRRSVNIIAEFNKVAKRSMFSVKEIRK